MFLNALSAIEFTGSESFGEKLWLGIQISIVGISVVFLMLLMLVLITTLFKKLFYDDGTKGTKSKTKKQAIPPVAVSQNLLTSSNNTDADVAAITAALMCVLEQEIQANPNARFVVRKIKKF